MAQFKIYQIKEANAELLRMEEQNKLLASANTKLQEENVKLQKDLEAAGHGESEALKTLKVDFEAQAKANETLLASNKTFTARCETLTTEVATLKTALAEKPSREAAAIVAATGTPTPLAATSSGNSGAPLAEDFSKLSPFNRALAIKAAEDKRRATLK